MSYKFESRLGEQLYQLLPEVYRARDKHPGQTTGQMANQDLARYLDAHGHVLDLIHATLEQQLKDTLPDTSQDWLLPYFAQLFAVNIQSPDSAGRHAEVDNAIRWRQGKGTLQVAEEIPAAVAEMEVEIQEGWKRVAITPQIFNPLVPHQAIDNAVDIDMSFAASAALHPGLPAAMIDMRRFSRAVESSPHNPATTQSVFGGIRVDWRQHNRNGVPCFPGSFDDVSRRTVDIRTPGPKHGHIHHKRLLAYVAPPSGLFLLPAVEIAWNDRHRLTHLLSESVEDGVCTILNQSGRIVRITDDVDLESQAYVIEGIDFVGRLRLSSGEPLTLRRIEAAEVDVASASLETPALTASQCLFDVLKVGSGLAELEACSVLSDAFLHTLIATDCVFHTINGNQVGGAVSYCRIPQDAPFSGNVLRNCTTDTPVFFANESALSARAVFAPATARTISRGARNGVSELGYFRDGRQHRPVKLEGDYHGAEALTLAEDDLAFTDLIFEGELEIASGQPQLLRCAVRRMHVATSSDPDEWGSLPPALLAKDCLFDALSVPNGLARLEYCTVMQSLGCLHLQASDSLFVGDIDNGNEGEPPSGCVRYSRVPTGFNGASLFVSETLADTNTRESPVFDQRLFCLNETTSEMRQSIFGEAGYGVLSLSSPEAIRFGAEDAGEMGAGHHEHYALKAEAALSKLTEFLPVGIAPVLIYDSHLLHTPAKIKLEMEEG